MSSYWNVPLNVFCRQRWWSICRICRHKIYANFLRFTYAWHFHRNLFCIVYEVLQQFISHVNIYKNSERISHVVHKKFKSLQRLHNGRKGVSNHQPHHCSLNRLSRCRSKKTSKLRVTGICAGNSPGTGEFPAQSASNAENVSLWWRHHEDSYAVGMNFVNFKITQLKWTYRSQMYTLND